MLKGIVNVFKPTVVMITVFVIASLSGVVDSLFNSGPSDLMIEVNLTHVGSNWAVPLTVGGKKLHMIVDTGNNQFTVLDLNYTVSPFYSTIGYTKNHPDVFKPMDKADSYCLWLLEDNSRVNYLNRYKLNGKYASCYGATAQIIANGTSFGESTILTAMNISIANMFKTVHSAPLNLHDWGFTQGNVGMAYGYNTTIFSTLIHATSKGRSGVFGLDLNAPDSKHNSSLQLGGIKHLYSGSMQWARQGYATPQYHSLMIKNLGMCNAKTNFLAFAPGINSYPVLVDTGQVCLNLPAEMYDAFAAWLHPGPYLNKASLPSVSFQVDSGAQNNWGQTPQPEDLLHIPLANLLVDPEMLDDSSGSPSISVSGKQYRLCILRGSNVLTGTGGDFVSPSPTIVFGSLVLQSIYFAADFQTTAVGLASKLDLAQINAIYTNSICKAPVSCVGQQKFDAVNNSCIPPACNRYFFSHLDDDSQMCLYRLDTFNAGVVIISFSVIFEVMSFFIMQYSGLQVMGIDIDNQIFRYSRSMNTRVDILTYWLGKKLCFLIDSAISFLSPLLVWRQREHEE